MTKKFLLAFALLLMLTRAGEPQMTVKLTVTNVDHVKSIENNRKIPTIGFGSVSSEGNLTGVISSFGEAPIFSRSYELTGRSTLLVLEGFYNVNVTLWVEDRKCGAEVLKSIGSMKKYLVFCQ